MNISTADRAEVLTQALPYIKQYAGKIVVIKYGGNAMISDELKSAVMEDIVLPFHRRDQGGARPRRRPEINEMLKKIGKESKFVGGLRYTDRETMDVVEMVLAGKVNKGLVQQLEQHGGRAIGLCGLDGGMIKAVKMKGEADLGLCRGYHPCERYPDLQLSRKRHHPGGGHRRRRGRGRRNLQHQRGYRRLPDRGGPLRRKAGADDRRARPSAGQGRRGQPDFGGPRQRRAQPEKQNIVKGGMIPKIECCVEAVRRGVKRTHIIDGRIRIPS